MDFYINTDQAQMYSVETKLQYVALSAHKHRGRILGRNWDRNHKNFPPFNSQSSPRTDFTPPPPRGQKWFETGL